MKKIDKYPPFRHSLNAGLLEIESKYAPIAAINPVIVMLKVVTIPIIVGMLPLLMAGNNDTPLTVMITLYIAMIKGARIADNSHINIFHHLSSL
ncbi:hypothetical protein, partial [Aeromonas dhakensis]|uniref:hypothetical protein n=1 Tax=Aeromonas dhakensis TaxID=196024 RepID=UPI0034137849